MESLDKYASFHTGGFSMREFFMRQALALAGEAAAAGEIPVGLSLIHI